MKLFFILLCLLAFATFCVYAKAGEMAAFCFILSLFVIILMANKVDNPSPRKVN